jgi:ribA/ribD-fused uncharacterized protein
MNITDKYVFFWGEVFSQWYPAEMFIDGQWYNCCEQYMMHQKAIVFGDEFAAKLILECKDPKVQKEYGRSISGFNRQKWDSMCLQIVYRANFAKFSQNPELKKQLLDTGDRIFVEASPFDVVWGIGCGEEWKNIGNPMTWNGMNLLGFALTLVKHELKQ